MMTQTSVLLDAVSGCPCATPPEYAVPGPALDCLLLPLPDLPPLTYLTVDSLTEGVGLSQVVPYVSRLAAGGMPVTLHPFEKEDPPASLRNRLAAVGVRWRAHRFLSAGPLAGLE